MVIIEIDVSTPQAKKVLDMLETFPFVTMKEEGAYSKKFISKIKKAEKQKRTVVDPNDIWKSIL